MVKLDLTGLRFNRLFVVEPASKRGKHCAWRCLCDCGNYSIVTTDKLRTGSTKSCGCYAEETRGKSSITHGHCGEELFDIWRAMIARCYNPSDKRYSYYGGRGISVCTRWRDPLFGFKDFLEDMGKRPEGLTLERVDNDGNYSPENCKWESRGNQSFNKRVTNNKSGKVGVFWHESIKKFWAYINVDGHRVSLGYFETFDEAVRKRVSAEEHYYGGGHARVCF